MLNSGALHQSSCIPLLYKPPECSTQSVYLKGGTMRYFQKGYKVVMIFFKLFSTDVLAACLFVYYNNPAGLQPSILCREQLLVKCKGSSPKDNPANTNTLHPP